MRFNPMRFNRKIRSSLRSLAGFQRIHLDRGEKKTVSFTLRDRELSVVDEDGKRRVPKGAVSVWIGGGQSVAGAGQAPSKGAKAEFRVANEAAVPD